MATDRKDCYVTEESAFESEYANSRLRITLETLSRRPDGSVMPGFDGRFIKLGCVPQLHIRRKNSRIQP
ncbi:hypothetical protein RDT67_02750, partial [Serratia fonticola]